MRVATVLAVIVVIAVVAEVGLRGVGHYSTGKFGQTGRSPTMTA